MATFFTVNAGVDPHSPRLHQRPARPMVRSGSSPIPDRRHLGRQRGVDNESPGVRGGCQQQGHEKRGSDVHSFLPAWIVLMVRRRP